MKKLDSKGLVNVLATVVFPPLGVALREGLGGHFLLNLALTFFGMYILGLVHGLYVVLRD